MIEGCKHGPKDLIPQPCAECDKDARREEERLAPLKAKMRDLVVKIEYETRHEKPARDLLAEVISEIEKRGAELQWHLRGEPLLSGWLVKLREVSAELVALKAERAKAVEELKCFMGGWLEGGCQSVSEAIHAVRCNHEQTLAQLQRLVGDKLSPASAERAWQPIETAPKDGTLVALWDDRQHVAFTGFYGRPAFQGSMWWMNNGNIVHPTHWDRLPPPPASSERETKA